MRSSFETQQMQASVFLKLSFTFTNIEQIYIKNKSYTI